MHTLTDAEYFIARINASNITYDTFKQRVTLKFPQEILRVSKTSEHAAFITLKYGGVMNNQMAGFYRSRYKPVVSPAASVPQVGEYHFMFSTQFESGDARRAFPCFDEPNLKATFDISIELPEDQVALSNMNEKEVENGKEGRKLVKFERTPIMSTYVGYPCDYLPSFPFLAFCPQLLPLFRDKQSFDANITIACSMGCW